MTSISFHDLFIRSNLLFIPLLFAGICHLFVIHFDLFSFLKKPLNINLFGHNKTYRGIIIISFLSSLGVFFISVMEKFLDPSLQVGLGKDPLLLGFLVGLFAMLFELPNSFLKRRLGAKSGEHPQKFKSFFYFFNQADSVIGCTLLYALFCDFDFSLLVFFFFYTSLMHLVINLLFTLMKLRKNPF
jgi:CDP-diacylglycerol--serine O-phosphatidyltransferase